MDGLTGLLDGLVVMHELAASCWDKMYPALKRPRARGNLVGWMNDFVAPIASNATSTASARPPAPPTTPSTPR